MAGRPAGSVGVGGVWGVGVLLVDDGLAELGKCKMRYLITGASGFIGPHLVRKLMSDGHECRCLVRSIKKSEPLEHLGAEIIEGDITRAESLKGIARGMDCLLHLATLGHMSNFTVTEAMFEAVNVQGTLNVMTEAAREKVPRVVHCSSVAAMGICPDKPATEKSECRPHHPYGRSKLKAEHAVLDMVRSQGLPASIIRFSMVYGPGDWRDMLKLVRLAKKGLFPKIGSRLKLTPMIHVADAVQGILLAAQNGKPGEIYLITNRQSQPFDQIRKIIEESLGIRRYPGIRSRMAGAVGSIHDREIFFVCGKDTAGVAEEY